MVARLEHERAAREAAVVDLAAARAANDALERTVAAKRRFLSDLQADLAGVAAAVDPLRSRLQLAAPSAPVPAGTGAASDAAAAALPGPLHLAYALLAGAAQAYPELGVAVDYSAADGGNGGDRPRRPTTAGEGEAAAVSAAAEVAAPVPPVVTLTFSGSGGGGDEAMEADAGESPPPFAIALRWVPGLRLLTAGPAPLSTSSPLAATVLRTAFPGDDGAPGASLPSEAAAQLLAAAVKGTDLDAAGAAAAAFPAGRPDRPVRWAQPLGGLDLHPPLGTGTAAASTTAVPPGVLGALRSQQRAYTVLAALREAAAAAGKGGGGVGE
jgi:hypothetical protein